MTNKKGKKNPFRIINRALRDARVKNLGIASGDWGVEHGPEGRWQLVSDCACPLGLCLVGKKCGQDTTEAAAAKLLGQPLPWVRSFVDGVDNNAIRKPQSKQAYNFGQLIRAKYAL